MKFSLVVISLLVGAVSFIGCGSDSNGSSSGSSNSTGGINGVKAVATQVVCDPAPISDDTRTFDMKYAVNGDITVECKSMGSREYGEYKLKSGVNSLTVTQLKKVESYSGTINGKKAFSVDTYDYKAGTIHHKESSSQYGNYDCTETFVSPLPSTLTNASSIEDLFDWDGDNRISTTCPSSYDDDIDDENFVFRVNGIINYTITDSDGEKHYITETVSATMRKK